MKFPQIFMCLVMGCLLVCSCRETVTKQDSIEDPETSVPSSEYHQNERASPEKDFPKPTIKKRDSILEKRRKSRDLDTLRPQVASLG